jgi:hypothetical protein
LSSKKKGKGSALATFSRSCSMSNGLMADGIFMQNSNMKFWDVRLMLSFGGIKDAMVNVFNN